MRKAVILLVVMVLLISLCGCTAKYKEAIANLEEDLDDVEQIVDDLEDENEALKASIQEHEARPTVTPTPSPTPVPTPTPEPIEHLGISFGELVANAVAMHPMIEESSSHSYAKDMPTYTTEDFVYGDGDDPGHIDYYYSDRNINVLVDVDSHGNVHSIFIRGDEMVDNDRQELMIAYIVIYFRALDKENGGSIATSILKDNCKEGSEYVIRHNGIKYIRTEINEDDKMYVCVAKDTQ